MPDAFEIESWLRVRQRLTHCLRVKHLRFFTLYYCSESETTAKKATHQVTSRGFAFQVDALVAAYSYQRGRNNGRM